MTKRDWSKDRALKSIGASMNQGKESLAELSAGAGKPVWSKAIKQYVNPARGRRIDPNSSEGRSIIANVVSRYRNST